MFVLSYKLSGKKAQYVGIDNAIRTVQFIRNKCLSLWFAESAKPKTERVQFNSYTFNYLCKDLAAEFPFVDKLNAQARQAAAERAWSSISNFYERCRKNAKGDKGYPRYLKEVRSVEYKTQGWKVSENLKYIRLKDGHKIGWLRLMGGKPLTAAMLSAVKRVIVVRKADGYYALFAVDSRLEEYSVPTGKSIGIDVGLDNFYTDSNGQTVPNPKFLRKMEKRLSRYQRMTSRKVVGSNNRRKQRHKVSITSLIVSRQRKDFVVKTARCVVKSNDFVAVENLKVKNMQKNHKLAKSITDASWYQFRLWLEHYGKKFGKVVQATNPAYTSQVCSECGCLPTVKKELKDREHHCVYCGYTAHRDHNAARNILKSAMLDFTNTAGRAGIHAWGDGASTLGDREIVGMQALSENQESSLSLM